MKCNLISLEVSPRPFDADTLTHARADTRVTRTRTPTAAYTRIPHARTQARTPAHSEVAGGGESAQMSCSSESSTEGLT